MAGMNMPGAKEAKARFIIWEWLLQGKGVQLA